MDEHIVSKGQELLIQSPHNEWGKTKGAASVRLKAVPSQHHFCSVTVLRTSFSWSLGLQWRTGGMQSHWPEHLPNEAQGAQANDLLREKKNQSNRNGWLCSLEQNNASMILPGIRWMHSLITSHQERWWRSHHQVLLRAVSLTSQGLKTSQDFSRKWDKLPQSVCCLWMVSLCISEGRTHTVKWNVKQGDGRQTTLTQDWLNFQDLKQKTLISCKV